ncbi:beta,beta-carotene 15,15'-dioxygenase-like [Diadema setosum]|uniref:beta,beta-carotene 15,15'-dioxygenase-like n=1 Tax=Diadema setosum TaxID=31175 RepID=UPI003B3B49EF
MAAGNSATSSSDRILPEALCVSVSEDFPDGVETTVKGHIPKWLSGSLLRTGPGRYEFGDQKYRHMFDGQALLHRFTFNDGKVSYMNRFLDSDAYRSAMKENRIIYTEFGTAGFPDPCLNIFSRMMSTFLSRMKFTDNCNVNWMRSGDEVYVFTETPMIQKVNPETLEKEQTIDISKIISVFTGTAHPHQTKDETLYNLGLNFKARSTYNIIKIPPAKEGSGEPILKKASVALSIPCTETHPSYSHSFFMTPNYFVLVEQPLYVNLLKLASMPVMGYGLSDTLEFHADKPTRFHVVRRSDFQRVSTKYVSEPLFFFHQINAYEMDGHLVLDMCAYKDAEIIQRLYLKSLRETEVLDLGERCKRFILPLNVEGFEPGDFVCTLDKYRDCALLESKDTVFCKPIVLADLPIELPRINYEKHNGTSYQYVYGFNSRDNQLCKVNVETGTGKTWSEEGCVASEPVFIGSPDGQVEDDGIVVSSVLNFNEGGLPYLLVLDAKSFTELGRAEIPIKKMSYGIHGMYMEGYWTSGCEVAGSAVHDKAASSTMLVNAAGPGA